MAIGPSCSFRHETLGGVPSIIPDVPVDIVFVLFFIAACAAHAFVFRRNSSAGRKFLISLMVIGFCLSRMLASGLRIAWACHPSNVHIAIAATVLVYAGVVPVFLANFIFAQRLVRAQHPHWGWSRAFTVLFAVTVAITIAAIPCLISATILECYTRTQAPALTMQRYGALWLAVFAFLPVLTATTSTLARAHPRIRRTTIDKFGQGSMRAKVTIVLISGMLLCLGASFRAATMLLPAVEPALLSKACFYIFGFTIEAFVCFFWLHMRVDLRFHVPDGASGAFSYAGGFIFAGEMGNQKKRPSVARSSQQRIITLPSAAQSRNSFLSSRVSLTSQRRNQERLARMESRISWGGVSPDVVQHGVGEDGRREIPYAAVDEGFYEIGLGVNVEPVKELGWDPGTGRYALRSITSVGERSSQPTNTRLYVH